jgi:hypothetical protein
LTGHQLKCKDRASLQSRGIPLIEKDIPDNDEKMIRASFAFIFAICARAHDENAWQIGNTP